MKHPALCHLLFPLLLPSFSYISNSEFLDSIIKQNDQLQEKILPIKIQVTNKYAFGILDGDIWNIDFKEMISNINSSFIGNTVEDYIVEESWYFDNDVKINEETNMFDHLHIFLLNSYRGSIHKLIKGIIADFNNEHNLEHIQNLIKWNISENYRIKSF
jgi:hypothetical protein